MEKSLKHILREAEDEGGSLEVDGGRLNLFMDKEDRKTKHVLKFTDDDPAFRDFVFEILDEDERVEYDIEGDKIEIYVDN